MTIRYIIQKDVRTVVVYDEVNPTPKSTNQVILIKKGEMHFCDILEKCNDQVSKLRIYKPDGSIVTGYVYTRPFTMIDIFNVHMLFDGRFNVA